MNQHTAPAYLKTTVTLRKLELGEARKVGDYWYNTVGKTLEPVEPYWISFWWWRNRMTTRFCPHYRIVRLLELP